ncbi:YcaO-like family protein [Streptomyces sp. JCM17656]|nr:YcaO-like family protein [Streptomyces sp. JCM17656]
MGPLLSGVRLGTHRVAAPEETWQRLVPLLPAVGITRVADVTGLDDIGVPVWQAVRPNSANLSVSQGKGITHELARVSAAMESFELHCAERPQLITRTASPSQLSSQLPYDWADLVLLDHHAMATGRPITWCQSENLLTGTTAWVPTESVVVDMTLRTRWVPPTVKTTSNGLASGNILEEATVHALLELMERHALALAREGAGLWSAAVEIRPGAWGQPQLS